MKIMKTKNTSKFIKIIIMVVVLMGINSMFFGEVKADDNMPDVESIFSAGKQWIETGRNSNDKKDDTKKYNSPVEFVNELMPIGQILVSVGIGTLTIVSVIMAIRWITATPDKQAQLKQQLIGLVVAAFVIFGAVGIWEFVIHVMNSTNIGGGVPTSSITTIIDSTKLV